MQLQFKEAQRQAGVGAAVVAELSELIFSLEAPIGQVAAADTIYPF